MQSGIRQRSGWPGSSSEADVLTLSLSLRGYVSLTIRTETTDRLAGRVSPLPDATVTLMRARSPVTRAEPVRDSLRFAARPRTRMRRTEATTPAASVLARAPRALVLLAERRTPGARSAASVPGTPVGRAVPRAAALLVLAAAALAAVRGAVRRRLAVPPDVADALAAGDAAAAVAVADLGGAAAVARLVVAAAGLALVLGAEGAAVLALSVAAVVPAAVVGAVVVALAVVGFVTLGVAVSGLAQI